MAARATRPPIEWVTRMTFSHAPTMALASAMISVMRAASLAPEVRLEALQL